VAAVDFQYVGRAAVLKMWCYFWEAVWVDKLVVGKNTMSMLIIICEVLKNVRCLRYLGSETEQQIWTWMQNGG